MSRVIKVNVSTGWANCDYNEEVELPEDWDDWSEEEQDDYLDECAKELLFENCEAAAWVEEDE